MAKPRNYPGRTGFQFRCDRKIGDDTCDAWIEVGFNRLESNPNFECYQCGGDIKVPNSSELVRLGRRAQAALQSLHEEIDECSVYSGVVFFGLAKINKVTWV